MSTNESLKLREIVMFGKYYYPAWKCLNDPNAAVVCCLCSANLKARIGAGKTSECLKCADNILASKTSASTEVVTPVNKFRARVSENINVVPSTPISTHRVDNK